MYKTFSFGIIFFLPCFHDKHNVSCCPPMHEAKQHLLSTILKSSFKPSTNHHTMLKKANGFVATAVHYLTFHLENLVHNI